MGWQIYSFFNILYNRFYPLYKPIYWTYKTISDYKKITFFKNNIKPGMSVLDIGANIGYYTLLFSKRVKSAGSVIAFEPDEKNFFHLANNTKKYKNIKIYNYAVSGKTGSIKLYRSSELNVDHQTYDIGENRICSEIKAVALDDFLSDLPQIDFVKVDIQGFDYFAIKGMKGLIDRSEKLMIFGELYPYGLEKSGTSANEYLAFLRESGFNLKIFADEDVVYKRQNDKFFYTDFYGIKN